MQWLVVPTPRRPLSKVSRTLVGAPPFWPEAGQDEMLPHCRARGGDVELQYARRFVAGYFVSLSVVFLLPCFFKIAHPALHFADDVDRFSVLDETLHDWIDAHCLDAGVGIQRVGVAAEALVHDVFEKAMDENDIATSEFLAAGHPLLDELAMVADEFEVEVLHPAAGAVLARCCLLDVRSRFRKAKYADSMASCRSEPSTLSVTA
jgi:hypothetical protein